MSEDIEHDLMREHLKRIDSSLEKMANSMSAFAITVAQSEIRHEKSEQSYLRLERVQDRLIERLDVLEKSIALCQERASAMAKPMNWLADKVGSVVVLGLLTAILGLVLVK